MAENKKKKTELRAFGDSDASRALGGGGFKPATRLLSIFGDSENEKKKKKK